MGDVIRRDVDKGWAWVVLAASMTTMSILSALDVSYGIFQEEIIQTFSGSHGFVALIFSVAFGGRYLLGPLSGIINDLVTPRVTVMTGGALLCLGMVCTSFLNDLAGIFFIFGIVCGSGSGLAFTASLTVLSTYFDKYRTLAFGISLGAPGIGLIGSSYLLRWLIDEHGWRFAMACFACGVAQICVLSSLFFPHDPSLTPTCNCLAGHTPQKRESSKRIDREDPYGEETELIGRPQSTSQRIKHLLGQQFLWVICLNQMMMTAGYATSFNFFPAYAQSVGVAFQDLPALYTAYGVSVIVARTAGGLLFTLFPNHLLKALFCADLGYALVQSLLPLYGTSFQSLFAERVLSSMMYGPSLLLVGPILVNYLGARNLPVAFGLVMLCSGIGAIAAPPIAGSLYDVYGSYNICYYLAGSASALSALSLLLITCFRDPRTSPREMIRPKEISTAQ